MVDEVLVATGAGLAAGLGVAMPAGAITALLLREALVNGFRVAAAAATGIALVDTTYCAVAASAGALATPFLLGHRRLFLVIAAVTVVAIGVRQLTTSLPHRDDAAAGVRRTTPAAAFGRLVTLTAGNPLTLVYFAALAGTGALHSTSWAVPVAFVAAAGLSSWAWQLLLAAVGSLSRSSLGPRATPTIGVVTSAVLIVLGIVALASVTTT